MQNKIIQTLAVASSIVGPSDSCARGPLVLQESSFSTNLSNVDSTILLNWHDSLVVASKEKNSLTNLKKQSSYIAQFKQQQIEDEYQFSILGGDHSRATANG